jgi:hypothetical protein
VFAPFLIFEILIALFFHPRWLTAKQLDDDFLNA